MKDVNDIITKMTKKVVKINIDLDEMMRETVIQCTETGKHLINIDNNGECAECGYTETVDDLKN